MNQPENLLIIHESMGGGGAERVLVTLLRHLPRGRFRITLLLLYREGVFLPQIPADVEVLSVFGSQRSWAERLTNHVSPLRNLVRHRLALRALGGRRFDVTVSFMEGPSARLHSDLLHLAPRNLSWVHSNQMAHRWYARLFGIDEERRFYSRLDGVAFVSAEVRRIFSTLFDTSARKEVIYNPVEVSAPAPGDTPGPVFTILNVGRLVKAKRQDRLLEAAAILKARGHRFRVVIAGAGPLESALRALTHQLGLDDFVTFAGFVADPFALMRRAHVLCLTSESEGFGMVVAESLLTGTPVVATAVSGLTEVLDHGGGILTPEDPGAIADALERLITDPGALGALRAQAPAAGARFSPAATVASAVSFISHR